MLINMSFNAFTCSFSEELADLEAIATFFVEDFRVVFQIGYRTGRVFNPYLLQKTCSVGCFAWNQNKKKSPKNNDRIRNTHNLTLFIQAITS
jgi:hypothetical protein